MEVEFITVSTRAVLVHAAMHMSWMQCELGWKCYRAPRALSGNHRCEASWLVPESVSSVPYTLCTSRKLLVPVYNLGSNTCASAHKPVIFGTRGAYALNLGTPRDSCRRAAHVCRDHRPHHQGERRARGRRVGAHRGVCGLLHERMPNVLVMCQTRLSDLWCVQDTDKLSFTYFSWLSQ